MSMFGYFEGRIQGETLKAWLTAGLSSINPFFARAMVCYR